MDMLQAVKEYNCPGCVHGPEAPKKIHESWDANMKTISSVPVWKHLDRHGNTVIRWFSPRTNVGWSTVVLGDCRDKIPNALEITEEHVNNMD